MATQTEREAAALKQKEKEAEASATATTTSAEPPPEVPQPIRDEPPTYTSLQTYPTGCPHVNDVTWHLIKAPTAMSIATAIPDDGITATGILLVHRVSDEAMKKVDDPPSYATESNKSKLRQAIRKLYTDLAPACVDLEDFVSANPGDVDKAMLPLFAATADYKDDAYYAPLETADDIGAYKFEENIRKADIVKLAQRLDADELYSNMSGGERLGRALASAIDDRVRLISMRAHHIVKALDMLPQHSTTKNTRYSTASFITAGDEERTAKYQFRILQPDMLAPSKFFTVYVTNSIVVTPTAVRLTSGAVQPLFPVSAEGSPMSLLIKNPRHAGDNSAFLISVAPDAPTVPLTREAVVGEAPVGLTRHGIKTREYGLCQSCVEHSLLDKMLEAQRRKAYAPTNVQFLLHA